MKHPLEGHLEAQSELYPDAALISVAISLKRIADALTEQDPYRNPIAVAIQSGINLGAQDWIGHMARNRR